MPSLPLELHEVLEEEYVSMYGPLEPLAGGAKYSDADIVDEPWGRAILVACGVDASAGFIAALNVLVAGTDFGCLRNSPAIAANGRTLIDDYDDYVSGVSAQRREEINRRIVDGAFAGAVRPLRDVRLARLYGKLHARNDAEARSALCLSGGGIRSASFALGVVQGLAGANILDKFDYLSTVSGGGYIGSWLSSWVRRHPHGISGVQDDLVRSDSAVEGRMPGGPKGDLPASKVDPEPPPLRHLRDYTNYLSPRTGFLSPDTWTMAALYLRNVLLNLLVLVPLLAGLLAIPRLFSLLLRSDPWFGQTSLLRITVVALAAGFGYLGAARPTIHGRHAGFRNARWLIENRGYLLCCVVPLTVAANALSLYWAKVAGTPFGELLRRDGGYYIAAGVVMILLPALIYSIRFFLTTTAVERRESLQRQHSFSRKLLTELLASVAGVGTAMLLLYVLANKVFLHPVRDVPDLTALPPFLRGLVSDTPVSEIYVCFAVPLVLLVIFVHNTVFVGLSGTVNEDYDREWWSRGAALLLMTAMYLGLGSFVAVFGPVFLYRAPLFVGSIGGISGVVAGLLAFSARTPANGKQKVEGGTGATITNLVLSLSVPLFVIVFLAAISLATTMLIRLVRQESVPVTLHWVSQFQSSASFTQTAQPGGGGATLETRYEAEKTPYLSIATVDGLAHLKTVHGTHPDELAWIAVIALGAVILSRFISVNQFSMHGFYKNRLVRAYLGASRYTRDPDGFTGFDPHDNLRMYELRHELLWPTSFGDIASFVAQLKAGMGNGSVEQKIWAALDPNTRQRLENNEPVDKLLTNAVVQNLNEILLTADLGGSGPNPSSANRLRSNRDVLQATFKSCLAPSRSAPLHVVNASLNVTASERLAWQERQAESFTISPLHSGSLYLGYRDSKTYAGTCGISLGTAATISGAAASPNQGYHSSPALAFLLTVLNIRLGSWLGNPGLPGRRTYRNADPRTNLEPLAWELTGSANDQCPLVYLSDGGHFENLGIYEMVLRRCRYIVASDAGCDPQFAFDDLGNAIRKIRIDLGVPIDIQRTFMFPRASGSAFTEGRYVTTARIRYSAIDENAVDGTLVYLKPGLYSDDDFPKDVYNYAQASDEFPHEPTSDQFFSESQFESYRTLGRHVINEVCGNYSGSKPPSTSTYASVSAFADAVQKRAERVKEARPVQAKPA